MLKVRLDVRGTGLDPVRDYVTVISHIDFSGTIVIQSMYAPLVHVRWGDQTSETHRTGASVLDVASDGVREALTLGIYLRRGIRRLMKLVFRPAHKNP